MIQKWHIHNQFEMDNTCDQLRSLGYTGEALKQYKWRDGSNHCLYTTYYSVIVIDHYLVHLLPYFGYRWAQFNGVKEYGLGIDFKKVSENE